jgi:addiction module RelB/DinJ family antitoxin
MCLGKIEKCIVKRNTKVYYIGMRKGGAYMAVKTANVTARIQPNIKESAEAILERLGIPVSVFIDMTYRQVIMHDGIPFSVEIPNKLTTKDSMSDAEFDTMMSIGLSQAKADESIDVEAAFSDLRCE